MNKREAKKYVLRCLAETIAQDLATGADYIFEEVEDADFERVERALEEIAEELRRRGKDE